MKLSHFINRGWRVTQAMLLTAVIGLAAPSCGGDDDDPEPEKTEKPDTPDTPDEPGTPDQPDEPAEPEKVPAEGEFVGNFRCVWYKHVSHTYVDDVMGWTTDTSVYTGDEIQYYTPWCRDINLTIHNGSHHLFWTVTPSEVSEIYNLVETGGSGQYGWTNKVVVENGTLKTDFVYRWEWYPDTRMLVLFGEKNKVQHRWKIKNFTEEGFEVEQIFIKYENPGLKMYSDNYYRFVRVTEQ